ncbi:MAG: hypothetical protein JNK87_09355, partial [Bryobacterales bacterium]|nr:hypothetical protein [Bryobacterales bacterium]
MLVQGEERQRLVDEILNGAVLGRSDQLRRLLRYLADEEAAGRGSHLTEYTIGVNALGRPVDYAPDIDSTVRTRMHELRRRLDDHYRQNPEAEWRLELPKGSYRLRFSRREPETSLQTVVQAEAAPDDQRQQPPPDARRAFILGMILATALLGVGWTAKTLWVSAGERAARLIWGPMLAKGETVTLLLATTPQLWVREFGDSPHPVGDPPQVFPMPSDPALLDWYRRTTLAKGEGLILHPNNHSPLGGEAHAAIRLAAFVAERQAHVELLAGEHTGATEIRERNAVVLGRAEYSRAAAALQPNDGWAVRYVPERREVGIVSQKGDRPSFFREGGG